MFIKYLQKYLQNLHLLYDCETLDGIWEHVEGKLNDANLKIKI